jgi:oxygen-dependent protoporphyrinogen oxidase
MPRVAVVGGGITGLAAAHFLRTLAGDAVSVTVFEASDRPGGVVVTDMTGGVPLEGGPDSLLVRKPAGVGLARELGLGDALMPTHPEARGADIFHEGRLYPIPAGILAGVPADPKPLLSSGLLSEKGKRDLLRDRIRRRPHWPGADVSLGDLLKYHLGTEMVDRIAAPLLSGIYAGDIWQLSARATYPQVLEWEARHRSLMAGRAAMPPPPPGPRPPIFMTPRSGLQTLVGALARELGASVRLETPVSAIEAQGDGYRLSMPSGPERADAVVVAVPAPEAARLVEGLEPAAGALLRTIPYARLAVVGLLFERDAVVLPAHKTGVLVPKGEDLQLTAVTYVSQKWPYKESPVVPVRVFYGRSGDDRALDMPDAELVALAVSELGQLCTVNGPPRYARVFRHAPGMPQYTVGHLERLSALEKCVSGWPGLRLAGAAYRGVGIPDCVKDGEVQARSILEALSITV